MKIGIQKGKVILNGYVIGNVILHDTNKRVITYEVCFMGEKETKEIKYHNDITTKNKNHEL